MSESEFAWVIERADTEPSAPAYWIGGSDWSQDNLDAVRFSRKQDAEKVASQLAGWHYRIAEHGWNARPAHYPLGMGEESRRLHREYNALVEAQRNGAKNGPDVVRVTDECNAKGIILVPGGENL